MKQDIAALLWPALVGVLAAAIILDKWVLERDHNTLGSAQSSYREAVSRATPSVVNIYTAKLVDTRVDPRLNSPLQRRLRANRGVGQRIERSLGSGVILSDDGHIVTNNHVIAGADAIQILLADGRSASASVVGTDPETDLAILRIELTDLTLSLWQMHQMWQSVMWCSPLEIPTALVTPSLRESYRVWGDLDCSYHL